MQNLHEEMAEKNKRAVVAIFSYWSVTKKRGAQDFHAIALAEGAHKASVS